MMSKGQINAGIVWTVVILLVAVAFGGLIFGKVQDVAEKQTEGTGTTTTTATLNSTFSDNTGAVPDSWDNAVEGDNITNAWSSSEYVTATRTDNGLIADNYENSNWYQALTVSSIHDEISSATLAFKYRLIDNENLSKINLEVRLCDGTDNTTVWTDNSVENSASWTSKSYSVLDNISSTGTYTVYLRAEIAPDNSGVASSIQVGWNDVSLSVNTYGKSISENIIADVGETGSDVFPLILLLVLIGVFVAIIAILKVLG